MQVIMDMPFQEKEVGVGTLLTVFGTGYGVGHWNAQRKMSDRLEQQGVSRDTIVKAKTSILAIGAGDVHG